MSDFHCSRTVKGRKPHYCEQCGSTIEAGERHYYVAQVWDGGFHAFREHIDCHDAWRQLNFDLRDLYPSESAAFLQSDAHDIQDKLWMIEKHPVVAKRLGWEEAAQ